MGETLFESGALSVGARATPQGPRIQIAIAGALDGRVGATTVSRGDVIDLVSVLREWIQRTEGK